MDLKTNGAQFRIYLLDQNIIRIRGTFDDEFSPEESYALVKTAWDDQTDELMKDERQRVKPIPIKLNELEKDILLLITDIIRCTFMQSLLHGS